MVPQLKGRQLMNKQMIFCFPLSLCIENQAYALSLKNVKLLWNSAVLVIIQAIWEERSHCSFEDKVSSEEEIWDRVKFWVASWLKNIKELLFLVGFVKSLGVYFLGLRFLFLFFGDYSSPVSVIISTYQVIKLSHIKKKVQKTKLAINKHMPSLLHHITCVELSIGQKNRQTHKPQMVHQPSIGAKAGVFG